MTPCTLALALVASAKRVESHIVQLLQSANIDEAIVVMIDVVSYSGIHQGLVAGIGSVLRLGHARYDQQSRKGGH